MLFVFKYLKCRLYIILSNIFEKQGSTDIGLWFPNSVTLSALKTGVTLAIFSWSGKQPFSRERLKMNIKGFTKGPKQFLTTLKIMSS